MHLYLVRHGPAAPRDPRRWPDDMARPLTPEGVRKTRSAAAGFAREVPHVDRLLSSPARRAHQTAKLFGTAFDPPPGIELWEDLGPGSPPAPILEKLRRTTRSLGAHVMVVGHQPGLEQLIGLALTGDGVPLSRFSKAGAASLEFPRAIRPGGARLEWLVTRSQLSSIAK
jgi:phosphohistidine phosphatase